MKRKYDILLCDLDNTVLDFTAAERSAIKKLLVHFGTEPDDEAADAYSEFNDSLWKRLERREITRDELIYMRFREFFKLRGIDGDGGEAAPLYEKYLSEGGDWIEHGRDLFGRCKGKVRIYIISNGTARVQLPRLRLSGVDRLADGYFISELVGYNKPDMRYFDKVFAEIPDFDRERALLLGDSITADVTGGIICGIDTCLFDRYGKFRADGRVRPMYVINELPQIYGILNI